LLKLSTLVSTKLRRTMATCWMGRLKISDNGNNEASKRDKEESLKRDLVKFTKAVNDNPNDSMAWYDKMRTHFKLNQLDDALECAKTILTQEPSWTKFVGRYFPDLADKVAKEQEATRQARNLETKLLFALEDLVVVSSGVHDWKERLESLEEPARELFREFLTQWISSDITQGDSVRHDMGATGGIVISGQFPKAFREAVTLFRGGHLRKPMEIIESSLQRKEHFGLRTLLGLINNTLEHYDKALAAFEIAASQNPYLKDIWDGMTTALNALKDPDKARLTSQIAECCPIKLDLKGESPIAQAEELLRRQGIDI
jgi:tetratricopeptide (TPR) repeat protein